MSDLVIQGRQVRAEDLALIRRLLDQDASLHRSGLSRQLCELWNWRTPTGRPKDIAARSLLRKLESRGLIRLPPRLTRRHGRRSPPGSSVRVAARCLPELEPPAEPLKVGLAQIQPLRIERVDSPAQRALAFEALRAHHYLGFSRSVGENVGYLIFAAQDRLLAVTWFGAAAWKASDRDRFIGWTPSQRQKGLMGIANNMRFLILPWVVIPQLGSHILGRLARRLPHDWREKYAHEVVLLESFIEAGRFQGTSYRAANWIVVGRTAGRSRQDRHRQLSVAPKLIALLALEPNWRQRLLDGLWI